MNNLNDIPLLTQAIEALHECHATHVSTVAVEESLEGVRVWFGKVEVFDLRNHPQAARAFAWNYRTKDGRLQSVAILKVPPVGTAADAVRSAIAGGTMPRDQTPIFFPI